MPTINEILTSERANNGTISLYSEGIFYKAYEYSAYLFVHHVRNYKLKRKYYKVAGQDVVSTGFPMSALATLPLPQGAKPVQQNPIMQPKTVPQRIVLDRLMQFHLEGVYIKLLSICWYSCIGTP